MPLNVSDLPETTPVTNIRALTELEYRNSTTPSNRHRYLTLGRYSVDGFTFDASMEDIVADPLKIHSIIWYQYMYHLDHGIDIPEKLLAWATQRTQQYLNHHTDSALLIDTKKVSWKKYSRIHSLSDNWSVATHDKNTKKNPKEPVNPPATAMAKPSKQALAPRVEAPVITATSISQAPVVPARGGQQRTTQWHQESLDSSILSEGNDSSLFPTSNVRVCDGTKRVVFTKDGTLNQTLITSFSWPAG